MKVAERRRRPGRRSRPRSRPTGSAAGLAHASAPALRTHLAAAVADDFAKDRIVNVAGWQLPLTEARIAALLYLQH